MQRVLELGLVRTNPELAAPAKPSALQLNVAARIKEWARAQRLPSGAGLTALGMSHQLGVSRTPVRAALALLEGEGLLQREHGAGYRLCRDATTLARQDAASPVSDADRLFIAIARDRLEGKLPNELSEADLMRRYQVTRPTVLKVLTRLAEVGHVERKTGHGWAFLPLGYDADAQAESYRFRMLVEPAGLLQPDFKLDAGWCEDMRQRHEAMLAMAWQDAFSVVLFDLNAEFHEGLAAASGNRFVAMAVHQQNRLRRFVNVHWTYGAERVQVNCKEHLEILARVQNGEREVAAALMRRHLELASGVNH